VFIGDLPSTNWAVLGGWVVGGNIYTATPTAWAEKTFTGVTPGTVVGFRFKFAGVLDDGGGNVFAEIEGATVNRFSALNLGGTFWTYDGRPVVAGDYITTTVPMSGDYVIRLGWENMGPTSSNGQGVFSELEVVEISCEGVVTTHRLDFCYPLEEVRSWRQPREGSVHLVYPSGEEASWIRGGHDGFLEAELRWVPRTTTVDPLNDGWEALGDVPGWQQLPRLGAPPRQHVPLPPRRRRR
jgi:hypothetical protein